MVFKIPGHGLEFLKGDKMDAIKSFINGLIKTVKETSTPQKMKMVASFFMLLGGTSLVIAAATDNDSDVIDISETAKISEDSESADDITEQVE